jgi:hypothetical protein
VFHIIHVGFGIINLLNKEFKMAKRGTHKIGRDARTGEFIPVKEAERRKSTAVVETIKNPKKK